MNENEKKRKKTEIVQFIIHIFISHLLDPIQFYS